MLSDRGIMDYISRGLLGVEPVGKIGPASMDLCIGDNLYRSEPLAWLSYEKEIEKLAKKGDVWGMERAHEAVGTMGFDEFIYKFAEPVQKHNGCWILEPNSHYYAQTAETVTKEKYVPIRIAARSSVARTGLMVESGSNEVMLGEQFSGKLFLLLKTYGTTVELPENYSILQIAVDDHVHLTTQEIKKAIKKGEVSVSGNPLIWDDAIFPTFHPTVLRYNGRTLNPAKDNSDCFDHIDITNEYLMQTNRFYLASTQEKIWTDLKHVGVLQEFSHPTYVHMNAPYHWPGSNHTIVLEFFPVAPIIVKAGKRACRMQIEELYPECESGYNSKYSGQSGPVVSRL